MTRKRGRGSRFQVWVAVPVIGVLTGAGLAALVAQGLGEARHPAPDRAVEAGSPRSDGGDGTGPGDARALLDALRVRPAPRPTLLRPVASETPLGEPASLLGGTVLSSPVLSSPGWSAPLVAAAALPPSPVADPVGPVAPPSPAGGNTGPDPVDPPIVSPPVVDPPVVDPVVDPPAEQPPPDDPYAQDPGTDPATDPTTDPVTDPSTDPATDPATDPSTDPVVDPAAEPAAGDPLLTSSEPAPSGAAAVAAV